MNFPHIEEGIDIFDCVYYRLNKKLLCLNGLWPNQSKFKSFLGNMNQYLLFTLLIPELLGLWKNWGDFDMFVDGCTSTIVGLVSLTLLKTWVLKKDKMTILLEEMRADWKFWLKKPEIGILHKYAMRGRMFTVAYATYIYSTGLAFINLPLIPVILDLVVPLNESRPKQPLFVAEYFADQDKYLYPILAQDYICSISATSLIVVVETMFVVYTQHACGIFSMIGFVESINDCFSTGFFIIMALNMLIISLTGIQTVMKYQEPREVIRYGLFTASQMFHLYFLSVPCQNLIDHSLDLGNQIYNSNWYKLPIRSQKLLLFIMRRCSNPCEFIAGVIFKFSIETFASVLHTSMSYFTVLSSIR